MAAAYTYPGVYIKEIPSGVRTISGVSTSVAAFVGVAPRGLINKPVHIFSFTDYVRNFGGLADYSEMGYAVQQFFLNGGSEAWIVRVASNVLTATLDIANSPAAVAPTVLTLTAAEAGNAGSYIDVAVDYNTPNPAQTFNLTVSYNPPNAPNDCVQEVFQNLSMNSKDSRYVESVVNGNSRLVSAKGVVPTTQPPATSCGTFAWADLQKLPSLPVDTNFEFRVVINGLPAITVQLSQGVVKPTSEANLASSLGAAIQGQLRLGGPDPGLKSATCVVRTTSNGDGAADTNETRYQVTITSGTDDESSSVQVLPGINNDVSAALHLGVTKGGTEISPAGAMRPRELPVRGRWTSSAIQSVPTNLPAAPFSFTFELQLDGMDPVPVSIAITSDMLNNAKAGTAIGLGTAMQTLANAITLAVRALQPKLASYSGFTCSVNASNQLVLESGTSGRGSLVNVQATQVAGALSEMINEGERLDATGLTGGHNDDVVTDVYGAYAPRQPPRTGIYALENVDLFNLLCLPGVTDPSTLIDASVYCTSRRAFLIVDCPMGPQKTTKQPDDMASSIQGATLPKSDCAAIYYPWIQIGDPLNSGKLRTVAPCGSIAGMFARTDATRGVWKAPAGTDANLVGAQGVGYVMTDAENGSLNTLGVNCIRLMRTYGVVNWGARTLMGSNDSPSDYKYVPVRRLALFLEESLYRGTQWVVFEPNDEPLWAQIRLNIGAFMHSLFRQGAFQGKTPKEAYFVKCDSETTTQDDINSGVVNIIVGFAPLKPAEFVVIQLQQMAGQIQV